MKILPQPISVTSDHLQAQRAWALQSQTNALGIFHIPPHTWDGMRHALGTSDVMAAYLPQLSDGSHLSRGWAYYDISTSLKYLPVLAETCHELLESLLTDNQLPFTIALIENLFNQLAAATYALWEMAADAAGPWMDTLEQLLDTLRVVSATHLSLLFAPSRVSECVASVDWEFVQKLPSYLPHTLIFRRMREFDNKVKVVNEILYLVSEVLPAHNIDAVLFPLYGALTLACYFDAWQYLFNYQSAAACVKVQAVRLGAHDQSHITFLDSTGHIILERLLPEPWIPKLVNTIQNRTVLIVDDNVGYGTTLRLCKRLIHQLDGCSRARSAETAWHLFERNGLDHSIADAVDFPSLRPNFHHSTQTRLIDLLSSRQYSRYLDDEAAGREQRVHARMAANLRLAQLSPTWDEQQLAAMQVELDHASRFWIEP